MTSAVLCSGGLDSTVLLADELQQGSDVVPIHILSGLSWEAAEGRALRRLLAMAPFVGRTAPLVELRADVTDVYPADHWALRGTPPGTDTPDHAVYLEGRNLLLVSKAAVWCSRHGVQRLVLGPLKGNPFPDATAEFFQAISRAATLGLAHPLEVAAPYLTLSKAEVVARGLALGVPIEQTLSCMNPTADDAHCHACSKCREREAVRRRC